MQLTVNKLHLQVWASGLVALTKAPFKLQTIFEALESHSNHHQSNQAAHSLKNRSQVHLSLQLKSHFDLMTFTSDHLQHNKTGSSYHMMQYVGFT